MIDNPKLQLRILQNIAENVFPKLYVLPDRLGDADAEELAAQTQLATEKGYLNWEPEEIGYLAGVTRSNGQKLHKSITGDFVLKNPVVTASGREFLRRRAPFWWVRFMYRKEGVSAGIIAAIMLPILIFFYFVRIVLLALRVKFVLPD